MAPKFPGVDWYCDSCIAHLSTQRGFTDRAGVWKCRECGFKNSITMDNVVDVFAQFKDFTGK